MKKLIVFLIVLAAITALSMPAMAKDVSPYILHHGHWPKPSKLPSEAVKIWAPPGTITTVEVYSKGTIKGSNSKGHWVWAVLAGNEYCYIRACNCNNPITGSKPGPQPKPKPQEQKAQIITSCDEVEEREETIAQQSVPYSPAVRLEQKPYIPAQMPEWQVKRVESLTVARVWVPTVRVSSEPPVTCPGVNPPNKPPVSGPIGNPTAQQFGNPALNGPPVPTGAQAPVQIGNGTVPFPNATSYYVADPVTF